MGNFTLTGFSAAFSPQRFGGRHTELKLQVVTKYLEDYLKVMKNVRLKLNYIDAFAGTGWFRAGAREDGLQGSLLSPVAASKGSALRVLDLRYQGRSFDRYVFNDRSASRLALLREAVSDQLGSDQKMRLIEFSADSADRLIANECARLRSNERGVMFLDPFGMQVSWRSVQAIAASRKIDVWYLAPIGRVARLLQLRGMVPEIRSRRLNETMGGAGWEGLYRAREDLLGDKERSREAGMETIIRYFEKQWRDVFGDGALPVSLRLHRNGSVPFLLCFACSNSSPATRRPALSIASHLVTEASRGRLL